MEKKKERTSSDWCFSKTVCVVLCVDYSEEHRYEGDWLWGRQYKGTFDFLSHQYNKIYTKIHEHTKILREKGQMLFVTGLKIEIQHYYH